MANFRATAEGNIPFTEDEEIAWAAEQEAMAEARPARDKAVFIARVDADVDAIYGAVIGNRGTEYAVAEADALEYQSAEYTGPVPISVSTWATAKAQTAQWAADDIIATATAWRTAQATIRGQRLLRKEGARNAADGAALATVRAQWAGFVAAVRGQLGLPS